MDCLVTIKPHPAKSPLMVINKRLAERLNLANRKRGYVGFGIQKIYIDINISRDASEEEILLSSNVIDSLHIPDYVDLEVCVKGNEIVLGPCIGILASNKAADITKRRLKEISMSTLDYQRIRGAIIVFSLDKVDKINLVVDGYCYNPKTDSWSKGKFPYPLSIYRKTSLNDEWQNHFLTIIGDTVFNNYSFHKWDMYRWFSNEPGILPHLPYTKMYEHKKDVYDILKKYGVIYVKPIWGMKGFGVIKVSLENGKALFKYRKDDENISILADGEKEIDRTIRSLFVPGNHIIQQGLELITYKGGVVDFRCVMQKNEACKWECNGMIARIGAKGSVVSNISSGGEALPATELIREVLSLPETETFVLTERIISLCTKVCRKLDEYGINYGTLGLDLGIDKDKKIWLIEVNNRRPHPAIALRVNEILSYYKILASPLYYAKYLAGFGCREEGSDVL